jgi:O-methyltransferase
MMTADWILGTAAPLRRWLRATTGQSVAAERDLAVMFPEATAKHLEIMREVRPFTLTSWERVWALIRAVDYVHARPIAGDIVECGVWRGGSAMAAALALKAAGDIEREIWLFDTYAGMNEPTAKDTRINSDDAALETWLEASTGPDGSDWCNASIEDVRANLQRTQYPEARVRLIKGKVEQTLLDPRNLPERIAILRLDTDWYESTKTELERLFDRVTPGGIVILDDYGHWAGAKTAVDEFLTTQPPYLMHRIDASGRILVKA